MNPLFQILFALSIVGIIAWHVIWLIEYNTGRSDSYRLNPYFRLNPFKYRTKFKENQIIINKVPKNLEPWKEREAIENKEKWIIMEVGYKEYKMRKIKAVPRDFSCRCKYLINNTYELAPESKFNADLKELINE